MFVFVKRALQVIKTGFTGDSDTHWSLRTAVLNDCFLHLRFLPSAFSARKRRSLRFAWGFTRGVLILG